MSGSLFQTTSEINGTMTGTPEHLAERLFTDGQKSIHFFRTLTPSQWDQVIYTEGTQWQVSQLLAHFASAEKANARLVEIILFGGLGAPLDFEIDAFNEQQVADLAGMSCEDLLIEFEVLRAATVRLVRGMSDSDLSKKGRHPFLGFASVEEILKLIYRHNQIHLRDARKVL
jgi:hypothetical protein